MTCPRCGCTDIFVSKRGWSMLTGMVGRNKIILTCIGCGNEFRSDGQSSSVLHRDVALTPLGRSLFRGVGRILGGIGRALTKQRR